MESKAKGALILAAAFGNVTYFGIAVLQSLFPTQREKVMVVAILFEITLTPLGLVLGSALASIYGKQGQFSLKASLLAVCKMPLLWATAIALFLNLTHVPVPDFVLNATDLLASAVAGLMILSLGMALKYRLLFESLKKFHLLVPALSIKLFISPLLVFGAAAWLKVASPYFHAATIEAAMPTQLILLAIADRFDLDIETLAVFISVATVFSFITIPLVHGLVGS